MCCRCSVVAYSAFGLADPDAYLKYLEASVICHASGAQVLGGTSFEGWRDAGDAGANSGGVLRRLLAGGGGDQESVSTVEGAKEGVGGDVKGDERDGVRHRGQSDGGNSGRGVEGCSVGGLVLDEELADGKVMDPAGGCGVGGGIGAGANVERNRVWRAERKARKQRRKALDGGRVWRDVPVGPTLNHSSGQVGVERDELRRSLEAKWMAENELAVLRAQQQKAVLQARDLEQAKRTDRARLQRDGERAMVAIERAHATLKATGNVPGVPLGGSAETVVGSVPGLSGGCSISPSSSISEAEVRAMQREIEDDKEKIAELTARLEKMSAKTGLEHEFIDDYDRRTWTDTPENNDRLDLMYPEGFVKHTEYAPRGKFQVIAY